MLKKCVFLHNISKKYGENEVGAGGMKKVLKKNITFSADKGEYLKISETSPFKVFGKPRVDR